MLSATKTSHHVTCLKFKFTAVALHLLHLLLFLLLLLLFLLHLPHLSTAPPPPPPLTTFFCQAASLHLSLYNSSQSQRTCKGQPCREEGGVGGGGGGGGGVDLVAVAVVLVAWQPGGACWCWWWMEASESQLWSTHCLHHCLTLLLGLRPPSRICPPSKQSVEVEIRRSIRSRSHCLTLPLGLRPSSQFAHQANN